MNRFRSMAAASGDLAAVDWRRVERLAWVQPRLLGWRWELIADGATAARIQGRGLGGRGFDAQTRAASWRILGPRLFGPTSIHRGEEVEAHARARTGWLGHGRIERAAGPGGADSPELGADDDHPAAPKHLTPWDRDAPEPTLRGFSRLKSCRFVTTATAVGGRMCATGRGPGSAAAPPALEWATEGLKWIRSDLSASR